MVKTILWTFVTLMVVLSLPVIAQSKKPPQDPVQKALDEQRAKMIVEVPKITGAYSFGADQVQLGWDGMAGTQIIKDYFGPGADAFDLRMMENRDLGRMVHWKIKGIKPGKYYLGLWTQTNHPGLRTEYSPINLLHTCYLNGWATRFSTTSDPVQVKPGIWLGELQGKEAIELKDGDEISLACTGGNGKFLRLDLYSAEPARGHGVTGQSFGITEGMPQQVRLVVAPVIQGTGIDGQQHQAVVTIANPLPYAAAIEVNWTLADYFGKAIIQKTDRVQVEPHKTITLSENFAASGKDRAYQLGVRTRPVDPASVLIQRPVELLEFNDFTRIAFQPGRPGPLDVWHHVRLDLEQINTGDRMQMSLDGAVEHAPLTTRRVPATVPGDLKFGNGRIPDMNYWVKCAPDVYGRWYRKTFRVPDWMRGQRYLVEVTQAMCEGTIFMNGQKVGYKREGAFMPVIADVTDALKLDGDNELVICVRNEIALVSEDYVDQYDPSKGEEVKLNLEWAGRDFNAIALNSVFFKTVPHIQVQNTIVVPKVQEGQLKILARVGNSSSKSSELQLQFSVEQFGKLVPAKLPAQKVTVEPGKTAEVMAVGPIEGIVNWTPRNPALAKLVVTVVQDGKVVDEFSQRFGYRDVRVEGLGLTLNGTPARLLGAFQHNPAHVFERADGVTVSRDFSLRGTYNPIDLYDEIGKMTYQSLDTPSNSVGWKILNNVKYWDSHRRIAVETVWQTGFHPSIIGYDNANEIYHYEPFIAGPEGQDKLGEELMTLTAAIREKIDPDYWFFSDGNEDLGGRLNFTSFHYLSHGINNSTMCSSTGFIDQTNGHAHYTPDCFYINGAASLPKLGTIIPQRPDWVYGSNACSDTEIFWFHGSRNGIYNCSALGDKAAVSANYLFWSARGMAWTKESLDGYRDMDMAFIGGIYWRPFMAHGVQSVTFAMPQKEFRYFSGTRYENRLSIFDDEVTPGKLLFTWQLLDEQGKSIAGGQMPLTSTTKFLHRDKIAFEVPKVAQRTKYKLTMNLDKNGAQRAYEERVVEAWPTAVKEAARTPAASTVVFDPKGQLMPALKNLGYSLKTIDALDEKSLAGAKALVVGPMAIDDSMSVAAAAIKGFAAAGGRVIVLEQLSSLAVPADTYVEHKGKFSVCFVRATEHPVMQGLVDMDFQMWNSGHLVADRAYRRPSRGNFMTLVEAGYQGGLHWTPLMEIYIGKGSIMATQLPLTSKLASEPMAAEMLNRMIAYIDMPLFRAADNSIAVIDNASEAITTRLAEVRADVKMVKAPSADMPVTLLDLSKSEGLNLDEQALAAMKAYAQNGGTLVVHRAQPDHADLLAALTGKAVKISIQPYQAWEDRQMLEQPQSYLTAGMNNVDFYWRSHIISEAPDATEQTSNGVTRYRQQVQYVVQVEGVKDLLFPGGLVEVPTGKGRVIIDQVRWEMPEDDIVGGSPKRVLSMLLTNMGVLQKPPVAKPALPAGVTYVTLDISKQANTGTTDDQPGDKNPNWAGWGPKSDLHDLPKGKVMLGVPFEIPEGKLNAIVLRTNWVHYLKTFPDTVAVPVDREGVAGVWFLHSGGWAFGKASFGRREICYTDGTKEIVEMNGTNMGDWNFGRDQFPDEELTSTSVAWRGNCQQYEVTRVYKTLWVNPHPQKKIEKIVFTNADLPDTQWRFVPHMAVTLAMAPVGGPAKVTGDSAKAKALIGEATKLLEAKDTKQAMEKLDQAIEADPSNTGAWQLLTSLRAKNDDVKTFTSLCQRWMVADPGTYQPYNTLAEFLEQKGQPEEALKLYKRSLEMEWNQPPTAEAIRRLDKSLSK